jgi:hypothetical protein
VYFPLYILCSFIENVFTIKYCTRLKYTTTQNFKSFRVRLVLHSFNFLGIHPYTIISNNMTQVLNFIGAKSTFRLFEQKLVLGEEMEKVIYTSDMGWSCFTIDENIIKEN